MALVDVSREQVAVIVVSERELAGVEKDAPPSELITAMGAFVWTIAGI